ncbi:uncharacterized protein LOC126857469 isoform X2 [Cataglyphis hispanica]|uniref:uncharacterized protein LOC126857469 isoform X2 n=1 Tax=Cataglyphis hispanica TaxID=1086592 RepID=UPI002180170F|nr:uncharacterized protein LOC126857469 isoform X2 [Cataglyphis hispanica]
MPGSMRIEDFETGYMRSSPRLGAMEEEEEQDEERDIYIPIMKRHRRDEEKERDVTFFSGKRKEMELRHDRSNTYIIYPPTRDAVYVLVMIYVNERREISKQKSASDDTRRRSHLVENER